MKKPKLLLFVSMALHLASCSPPQSKTPKWYKGNLHTHSYWSDGDDFPERIMHWYKKNGYDFVALSDHNILARGEKWIRIPDGEIYQNGFEEYVDTYGSDWVAQRELEGKLEVKLKTYEEYKGLFEEEGKFLILQAEEITDRFEDRPIHLNATNLQEYIAPQGGANVFEVLQHNINAVHEQRKRLGIPMMVHINHPNFGYGVSLADMIKLQGERFFEVFNGHNSVHNMGDSLHIGTEEMWDQINIAYLEEGKPLIFGLGTDDSHNYHQIGSKWQNAGRGWVVVRAEKLEPPSLIEAMEGGDFYASTGVSLTELKFENNMLTVGVDAEEGVSYRIEFVGCEKGEKLTRVLKNVHGNAASFELRENHLFVRAKITSTKEHPNPIETFTYEMAWTQPVVFSQTK